MSVSFYGRDSDGERLRGLPTVNWSNGNAVRVLGLLRLPIEDQYGECSVADARRAVMYARATFDRRAPEFIREVEVGERYYIGGLDVEDLTYRIDAFAVFVEAAARVGAVEIYWG